MTPAVHGTDVRPRQALSEWSDPISLEVSEGAWVVVRTTPMRSRALLRLCVGLDEPAPPGVMEILGERPGLLGRDAAFTFRRSL